MDIKSTKEKYHNSDYFENIDREEKAYLLGYLIADSLHFSMNLKVAPKIYDYLYNGATMFLKRKE